MNNAPVTGRVYREAGTDDYNAPDTTANTLDWLAAIHKDTRRDLVAALPADLRRDNLFACLPGAPSSVANTRTHRRFIEAEQRRAMKRVRRGQQ